MRHSGHRRKQNSKEEWSEVKKGEHCGNEQGAGVEVNVSGSQVGVRSRVVGDPGVQVIQSFVKQEPQPVDEEGDNKVDPSPSPVHCQTFPCKKVFFKSFLCFTFGSGTKCDKSEYWEKEKGREVENETESRLPAASCSVNGNQPQDDPKG